MVFKKIIKFLSKKKNTKKNKRRIISKVKQSKKIKRKEVKKPLKVGIKKEKLVAYGVHYFSKISVAVIKLIGQLKISDEIHIKGYTTDFKQKVTSMQINHKPIATAKKGQEIGLLAKQKVRHKDKVYKI